MRAISSPMTVSPDANLMPRTPPDRREADRSALTAKRIAWPCPVTMIASSSSLQMWALTSSSAGSRSIAISPSRRTLAKFFIGVFFASPSFVPMTMNSFSTPEVARTTAVIRSLWSSMSSCITETPRASRLPSSTSHVLTWKQRPRSVKKIRRSCVSATMRWRMSSSSLVRAPMMPTPPRRCER